MVWLSSAHNGRGDDRLAEYPGKRELSTGNATLFGDLSQTVDDFMVGFLGLRIHGLAEHVSLEAFGAFGLPRASQASAGEWTPRDDTDTFRLAKGHHLALFFTIEQVVMILHRDKTGPAMKVREIERLSE